MYFYSKNLLYLLIFILLHACAGGGIAPVSNRNEVKDSSPGISKPSEKKESKRDYRLEKINAVKEKIYAVAAKRKWLFLIIAAAIVAYLVIFKGGFSFGGGSGILEKIKGFF